MTWTGAVVLFAVFFFVVLFVLLPQGLQTQEEDGDVVEGTPPSAPAQINMPRKFMWSAIISAALVGLLAAVMHFELVAMKDLSFLIPDVLMKDPSEF